MSEFEAGGLLKNKKAWNLLKNEADQFYGGLPPVLSDAIDTGSFDVRHRSFTNENAKNIKFQGIKYASKQDLLDEDFPNSNSVDNNIKEVTKKIQELQKSKAVTEISEEEARSPGSILSPILWIEQEKEDGSMKKRLVHHDRLNYQYAKPKFSMVSITNELDRLADFESLRKHDKQSAFYQFPICETNKKTLRFKIKIDGIWRFFQWEVMAMGMSGAPYVCQVSNASLTAKFSRLYKVYNAVYLDDFWLEDRVDVPDFVSWAEDFGLIFKKSKTEIGPYMTLLGLELNLKDKTARIPELKGKSLEQLAQKILTAGSVKAKDLASLYGKVEFSSGVCQTGRANTLHLTKLMAKVDLVVREHDILEPSAEVLKEIKFWSTITSHPALRIGKRKFTNGRCLASDASSKKYAFVIGPKSVAAEYPEHLKNEHIAVKEAYALWRLIQEAAEVDTDLELFCDNTAVCNSFNKQRSKNSLIHELIQLSLAWTVKLNCRFRVIWIDTNRMKDLADGPSRGVYKKSHLGLTVEGLGRLLRLAPSFGKRVEEGEMVSLFASPVRLGRVIL